MAETTYADVVLDLDSWGASSPVDVARVVKTVQERCAVRRIVLWRRKRASHRCPAVAVRAESVRWAGLMEAVKTPQHVQAESFLIGVLSARSGGGATMAEAAGGGISSLMDMACHSRNPMVRMAVRKMTDESAKAAPCVVAVFSDAERPLSRTAVTAVGYTALHVYDGTAAYCEAAASPRSLSPTAEDNYSDRSGGSSRSRKSQGR